MSIRVLQLIVPTAMYGAERWILALASHLDDTRVQCELAIPDEGQEVVDTLLTLFSPHGQTHRVRISSSYDLSVIQKIAKIVRERNINIIHTHGYKSDLIGLAVAKWTGCSIVSTPHGFGTDIDLKLATFIRIGARSLRYFDRVVPLSKQLRREVIDFGVPIERVELIENATDLKEIDEIRLKKVAPSGEALRLGYVGQLIPRKRVNHVLDAFDRLIQTHTNIELIIAGDGSERKKLERHAANMPSASRIKFVGFVEDRLPFMAELDMFLLGSISEGIPRCLMESMALGVTPIAYRIEGVIELITDKENGRCVENGNIEAFTNAVSSLISDKAQRLQLGEAAALTIRNRYSAARMAREYTSLFEELVASYAEI